jgi:hypothetical protein
MQSLPPLRLRPNLQLDSLPVGLSSLSSLSDASPSAQASILVGDRVRDMAMWN